MKYSKEQKALIKSKVKGIAFDNIPEGIKQFWINFKNLNDGKQICKLRR